MLKAFKEKNICYIKWDFKLHKGMIGVFMCCHNDLILNLQLFFIRADKTVCSSSYSLQCVVVNKNEVRILFNNLALFVYYCALMHIFDETVPK